MKKIFLFLSFAISAFTFSTDEEIVQNSSGEKIILKSDKTWEYESSQKSIKEFKKYVQLYDIEVSAKRSNGRSVTGKIKNNNRKTLEFVTYRIMWRVNDSYASLNEFTIRNLKYRESRDFNRRVKLEGISGRDYKIEVLEFKWK